MNEDELNQSFEDLISDISLPPAKAVEGTHTPPQQNKGSVKEEGAATPVGQMPGLGSEPPAAPKVQSRTGELQAWRQVYAEALFRASLVMGILAALIASYLAFRNQDIWAIPVYVGACAMLALITVWRSLPNALRVGGLLLVVYVVGLVDLLRVGQGGVLRPLLLVMPFLATLFLGRRGGIASLIVIALTMVGFGWAFSEGFIAVPVERQASSASPLSWLSGAIVLIVLGSLVAHSVDYVVQRLTEALTRNQSLAQDLEGHRGRLLEQSGPMERRAHLLKISAEVGRAITSILDADHLLRETVELMRDRFGWHSVAVYLVEGGGERLRLAATSGEAGEQMLAEGLQLRVGETSLVGWSANHRRPRVASNGVGDEVYSPFPFLPRAASEVALPLMVGNRLLGVLDVASDEAGAFDEHTVEDLQGLADQVATAIDNAARFQEEAALQEATNPVYRATRRLVEAASVDEVLDVVMKSVSETGAAGCVLGLFEPAFSGDIKGDSLTRTWHRHGPSPFAADSKLVSYADMASRAGVHTRGGPEPAAIHSTRWLSSNIDDRSRLPAESRPFLDRVADLASYAGLKLGGVAKFPLVAEAREIGFLFLYRAAPGRFSETSLRLYETLSGEAAGAVERARRYEEAQRSQQELRALNRIANAVSGSLQMEEVLQQTLEQTLALTRHEIGLISLVDPATNQLYLSVERGLPAALRHRLIEKGMDGTLCDHVYQQGSVLAVPDFAEGAPADVAGLMRLGLRSYLGIPLGSREAVVGTICVFSYSPYSSDPALIKLLGGVGRQVGVAIENARVLEQARQRAARERLVGEIAGRLRASMDPDAILKATVRELGQALGAEMTSVEIAISSEDGGPDLVPTAKSSVPANVGTGAARDSARGAVFTVEEEG